MYNYKTGIIYRQIDRQKYTQRGREREYAIHKKNTKGRG